MKTIVTLSKDPLYFILFYFILFINDFPYRNTYDETSKNAMKKMEPNKLENFGNNFPISSFGEELAEDFSLLFIS